MMKKLVGLARVAGTVKRAQFAPIATRLLPALGLAVPLVIGHAGVAHAKRTYELHEGHASNSYLRKASHRKHRQFAKFSRPMKLGAAIHAQDSKSPTGKSVQVASLGTNLGSLPEAAGKLSGLNKISWGPNANHSCLPDRLKPILSHIAESFGDVTINSTCRSHEHNRRVGGASRSFHLIGQAVDFRLNGNISGALKYLRTSAAGGIKHYGGGVFHIDTGPRRTW
jgi:hypothetical protein